MRAISSSAFYKERIRFTVCEYGLRILETVPSSKYHQQTDATTSLVTNALSGKQIIHKYLSYTFICLDLPDYQCLQILGVKQLRDPTTIIWMM